VPGEEGIFLMSKKRLHSKIFIFLEGVTQNETYEKNDLGIFPLIIICHDCRS